MILPLGDSGSLQNTPRLLEPTWYTVTLGAEGTKGCDSHMTTNYTHSLHPSNVISDTTPEYGPIPALVAAATDTLKTAN